MPWLGLEVVIGFVVAAAVAVKVAVGVAVVDFDFDVGWPVAVMSQRIAMEFVGSLVVHFAAVGQQVDNRAAVHYLVVFLVVDLFVVLLPFP